MNIHKDIDQLCLVGIDRQACMRVSKDSLMLSEVERIPSFGDAYPESCQGLKLNDVKRTYTVNECISILYQTVATIFCKTQLPKLPGHYTSWKHSTNEWVLKKKYNYGAYPLSHIGSAVIKVSSLNRYSRMFCVKCTLHPGRIDGCLIVWTHRRVSLRCASGSR